MSTISRNTSYGRISTCYKTQIGLSITNLRLPRKTGVIGLHGYVITTHVIRLLALSRISQMGHSRCLNASKSELYAADITNLTILLLVHLYRTERHA